MPISDATKKQIAQKRRLFLQVCLRCGARNPLEAERCRKCKSSDLRLKNRSVGLKK
jgi:large subunit ribosomal protein L40e